MKRLSADTDVLIWRAASHEVLPNKSLLMPARLVKKDKSESIMFKRSLVDSLNNRCVY
jgi:hypothetical protein